MAPRDKKGILFILRAVVQSYLSALCVHSRLANVLLRFNLDNKFQRGGATESYVHEQTLENQSRQLPESALLSRYPHFWVYSDCSGEWTGEGKLTQHGTGIHWAIQGWQEAKWWDSLISGSQYFPTLPDIPLSVGSRAAGENYVITPTK